MHHGHPIFTVITRFDGSLFFIHDPRDRHFYTVVTGNKEKVLLHLLGQRYFFPLQKEELRNLQLIRREFRLFSTSAT